MLQLQLPPIDQNFFKNLTQNVKFETQKKGRQGTILVRRDPDQDRIPLVRSTTKYSNPYQYFGENHVRLAEQIATAIASNQNIEPPHFNNAMIELYTNDYRTMGYHTDQGLDLEKNSWICLFTCYSNPNSDAKRVLSVKNKLTGSEQDLVLENNSIVFFSTATNKNHLHKIVLPQCRGSNQNNTWLGLTFRTSKTFLLSWTLMFEQDNSQTTSCPLIHPSNTRIHLATDCEHREFLRMKGEENRNVEYEYPEINYTLSPGDLMKPIKQTTDLASQIE